MAYRNLKAELVKHGIVQREVSDFLGMSLNNFSLKVHEKVPFTVDEIKRVRDRFAPDATLDYLLVSDGDVPTERDRLHHYAEAIGNELTKDGTEPDAEVDEIVRKFHDCADAAPLACRDGRGK